MDTRELIIGFDLTDNYSQLSYCLNLSDEPESLSFKGQEYEFLIPTVIGLQKNRKQWIYGEEAILMSKSEDAQIVSGLLEKIKEGNKVDIYGVGYDPIYLMERFIYKVLMEIKIKWTDKTIKKMVITSSLEDKEVVNGLYKALVGLGIYKDRVQIQSHTHSYLAYVLSQEKSIWMNDVALFDFNEEKFTYSQISIERRKSPPIAEVEKRQYNESISYDELDKVTTSGNFDYILENIINDALYKQIVSAIYFTGKGFIDGLPMTTIKKISKGRRIFIGQNLFCKGACYWAKQLLGHGNLDKFVFLVEDTVHYRVSITVYDDNREREIVLAKLGDSIYEAPKTLDLILDNEDQVKYQVRDKGGQAVLKDVVLLEDLPKRPNKTTRVQVCLDFMNGSRFKIRIIDKGFGDMYPATNLQWEKEVVIRG